MTAPSTVALSSGDTLTIAAVPAAADDHDGPKVVAVVLNDVRTVATLTAADLVTLDTYGYGTDEPTTLVLDGEEVTLAPADVTALVAALTTAGADLDDG